MKKTLLFALLLSAPLMAQMSYEEGKQKVESAQARYDAALKSVENQRANAEKEDQATESIAGKHEYADDIKKRTAAARAACEQSNQAIKTRLKTALEDLQAALKEVGPHYTIANNGDKYTVAPPPPAPKKPAPIVEQSAPTRPTRLPYEAPRTRRANSR